jgi:hypothetical protein
LAAPTNEHKQKVTRQRCEKVELLALQICCNRGELLKRSFQILDNLVSDNIRVGKVGALFEAFVFEPKDVEVEFVALG